MVWKVCGMRFLLWFWALMATPLAAQDFRFFTLAGGDVGGNYFATARAICAEVNRAEAGRMRCSPEATPGSVYNLDGLAAGEIDFAIVQSDWLLAARDGTGAFEARGPMEDLRGVLALYQEQVTLLAAPDADITALDDLKGARVDIGPPASGRRATAERLLGILNLAPTMFGQLSELTTGPAIDELCAGRLDAIILVTGHPDLAVARAISTCNARLVPFADPALAETIADTGLYAMSEIAAGAYGASSPAVPTYGVTATLVTRNLEPSTPDMRVIALVNASRAAASVLARRVPVLAGLQSNAAWDDTLGIAAHLDIPEVN
jgi:uncharacterized protein